MTLRVTVQQLRENLPDLLDGAANGGPPCVVRRNGKDCAVIVGIGEWRRRTAATRLDALGPRYRVPRKTRARVEELLELREVGRLTRAGRSELNSLLTLADEVMVRRARALDRVS